MDRKQFRIIPVIDLKGGLAVHAVRGQRDRYQPVASILAPTADFVSLATAFATKLGLTEIYVADLDAITDPQAAGNLAVMGAAIKKIRGLGDAANSCSFLVDAGVAGRVRAASVFAAGADKVIVGTETLTSVSRLAGLIGEYGPGRVVVSLDSRDGRLLCPAAELRGLTLPAALTRLRGWGAAEFILLELNRVGTAAGLNRQLISACLACLPQPGPGRPAGTLLVGGGIAGRADLEWLKQSGVSGALVATVLHDGRLTSDDLSALTADGAKLKSGSG